MATAKKKTVRKTPAKKASSRGVASKSKLTQAHTKVRRAVAKKTSTAKSKDSMADITKMLSAAKAEFKKNFKDLPVSDQSLKDLEKRMLPKDFVKVLDNIEKALKNFNNKIIKKMK